MVTPLRNPDAWQREEPSAAAALGGVVGLPGFRTSYHITLSSGKGGAGGYQLRLLVGESANAGSADFHINEQSRSFPSGEVHS